MLTVLCCNVLREMQWKKEIDAKVELPNGKPLPVILCGNKVGT